MPRTLTALLLATTITLAATFAALLARNPAPVSTPAPATQRATTYVAAPPTTPAASAAPTPPAPTLAPPPQPIRPALTRKLARQTRHTVAALEAYNPDGTRPPIPHVDPAHWLATTTFDQPPPSGLQRTVVNVETTTVAATTQVAYITASWHIVDHPPTADPTTKPSQHPPRDFVIELEPVDNGHWDVVALHPELPLGAAHLPSIRSR